MAKLKSLKANPDNPRVTTENKLGLLKTALGEFGDLGGIVDNKRTGRLVGGHQRLKIMPSDAEIVIERTYKKPTRCGTVAEGHVLIDGERFTYRQVDWPAVKERAANIAANKGAGEWDYAVLGTWFQDLAKDDEFNLDLTMFDENERKGFFADLWEDDTDEDAVEREQAHVEGFRDTIKVKCPKAVKAEVVRLLSKTIEGSKYRDAVEIQG
jgi:hypothetical protein